MNNLYVRELEPKLQKAIENELILEISRLGYKNEELNELVEEGMDSKVSDLKDTIDLEKVEAIYLEHLVIEAEEVLKKQPLTKEKVYYIMKMREAFEYSINLRLGLEEYDNKTMQLKIRQAQLLREERGR